MVKLFHTLIFLQFLAGNYYAQINDNRIRLKVLRLGIVGKDYKFTDKKDSTVTHLVYLGGIEAKNGVKYKILTSTWLWNSSHGSTNRVLIYNTKNQYKGEYEVGMTDDLPNYIKKNQLVFLNADKIGSGCDLTLVTKLDFNDGPPKEIFVNCKGKYGDIYQFYRE